MAIKILINGEAGTGKTSLLSSLDKRTFVASRDAKKFGLKLPHTLVEEWLGMQAFVNTVIDKLEDYNDKFGEYPTNVVIDSVSQIFMDVIDKASQTPNVYGSQGAEVTKEMAVLTKFIHEDLELNGVNVILLNHVITEKEDGKLTGSFISFGSGKFLEKGGFYSTTNESITIITVGEHRKVFLKGKDKQARTTLTDVPDTMWVENLFDPSKSKKLKEDETYFTLQGHLDLLADEQHSVEEWSL
jgi:hypothetical protein